MVCIFRCAFDLSGDSLRAEGHSSADAAVLPMVPGIIRYDETDVRRG